MTAPDDGPVEHATPLSQRRADLASGKTAWMIWLQWNSSDVARAVGMLLTLSAIGAMFVAAGYRRDTLTKLALNAPIQHSAAVVIDKQVEYADSRTRPRAYLDLKMNDIVVRAYAVTDDDTKKWARTAVGQTVTASFHAANGVYVLDDWEPPTISVRINNLLP